MIILSKDIGFQNTWVGLERTPNGPVPTAWDYLGTPFDDFNGKLVIEDHQNDSPYYRIVNVQNSPYIGIQDKEVNQKYRPLCMKPRTGCDPNGDKFIIIHLNIVQAFFLIQRF